MKNKIIPLLFLVVTFSSCSVANKAAQTADDVYYSPASELKETVYPNYNNPITNDDQYLRRKAHNYSVWSSIDNYSYWNDSRYDFGYSCTPSRYAFINSINGHPYGWGYGHNFYGYGWNGWNSPHGTIVYYANPKVYYGTTNKANLTAYRNNNYNNQNNAGGLLKRVFTGNSNGNGNNPSRNFNTGTNTSNNAGGRSGGYNSSGSSSSTPRPPRPPLK